MAVAALIQRHAMPPAVLVLAAVLVYGHLVLWALSGWMLRPWMDALLVAAAVLDRAAAIVYAYDNGIVSPRAH